MTDTSADNGHNPRYNRRLELAATVIQQHSDLNERQARALAAHVLRALDHIPEKIR